MHSICRGSFSSITACSNASCMFVSTLMRKQHSCFVPYMARCSPAQSDLEPAVLQLEPFSCLAGNRFNCLMKMHVGQKMKGNCQEKREISSRRSDVETLLFWISRCVRLKSSTRRHENAFSLGENHMTDDVQWHHIRALGKRSFLHFSKHPFEEDICSEIVLYLGEA